MYELDPNLDLSFLIDSTLIQVAVGRWQIILHFDKALSITVEHSLCVVSDNYVQSWIPGEPEAAVCILPLLGKATSYFERLGKSGLRLGFGESVHLDISGDRQAFEAYTISSPVGTVFV